MVITVFVKPKSSKGPKVEPGPHNCYTVFVREPAIDGRANHAAALVLADYFDVAPSLVELVSGASARHKRFKITT